MNNNSSLTRLAATILGVVLMIYIAVRLIEAIARALLVVVAMTAILSVLWLVIRSGRGRW